ncbi:AAA family ATPase [Sphingomonas panacisoli]|uniref:AAA family ATPase n=1 Tax=Sphingomonas panacisoli TaxID=1813879 RepID=A0A5B8LM22_9SPHN|nr:AAA family ATPase [Sphingomonas panacisoli]QDZ08492.1 AAA family ATPase [Sphingomonas panacisoli]
MWISKFRLTNFTSFEDSGWIELDKAINLFIGQNNSGKSALLKGLSFPLSQNPHKNIQVFRGHGLKQPHLEFDVTTSSSGLFNKFSSLNYSPTFPIGSFEDHQSASLLKLLSNPDAPIELEFSREPSADTIPRQGASIAEFRNPSNQISSN